MRLPVLHLQSHMRYFVCAAAVLLSLQLAGQQATTVQPTMAITFDDLPVHGALPPGETRLQIAQSILSTLKINQMPPVYGFLSLPTQSRTSSLRISAQWG